MNFIVRSGLVLTALAASLSIAGCATETSEGEVGSTEQGLSSGFGLPEGSSIEGLRLQGTGCPTEDSATVIIADDRQSFLVLFSEYEAPINPGEFQKEKVCTFYIKLRTPQGFSFQIANVWYEGSVALSHSGMWAEQRAKYWWMGNTPGNRDFSSRIPGPADQGYVFEDKLGLPAFSRCNEVHELAAKTSIKIRNNSGMTGQGYVNTSTAGGGVAMKFRFNPFWRSC